MRSGRVLVWAVALLAGVVTAAGVAYVSVGAMSVQIVTVDGRTLTPFEAAGVARAIFFVTTDCPISNSYAPEIQRVCRDYGPRGVECLLIYEDVETPASSDDLDHKVRAHLTEYGYAGLPAAVDRTRRIAREARASITPEVSVVDRAGTIRYRGRIDNFYAALGKPRQQVTEHDLRNALDALLSKRPVPTPVTQALGCHIVDPQTLRK